MEHAKRLSRPPWSCMTDFGVARRHDTRRVSRWSLAGSEGPSLARDSRDEALSLAPALFRRG
jgi:hypothetical protein